jgi:hypothetical protein
MAEATISTTPAQPVTGSEPETVEEPEITAKLRSRPIKIRKFNPFPRLPPEIRDTTWALAIPGARVITVIGNEVYKKDATIDHCRFQQHAKALADIPALLHVNKEARAVALKHYKLAFGTCLSGTGVYFNFSRDILHFDLFSTLQKFYGELLHTNLQFHRLVRRGGSCQCDLPPRDATDEGIKSLCEKVQNVIIGQCYKYTGDDFIRIVKPWSALKSLTLLEDPSGCNYAQEQVGRDEIQGYFRGFRGVDAAVPGINILEKADVKMITKYPRRKKYVFGRYKQPKLKRCGKPFPWAVMTGGVWSW